MKKCFVIILIFINVLISFFLFIENEKIKIFNYNFIKDSSLFTESNISLNKINLLKENTNIKFCYDLSIGDVICYKENKVSTIKQIIIEDETFIIYLENEVITNKDINGVFVKCDVINNIYLIYLKYKIFLILLIIPCFCLAIKEFKEVISEIFV